MRPVFPTGRWSGIPGIKILTLVAAVSGISLPGQSAPKPHHTAGGFTNPWRQDREHGFKEFMKWRRTHKRAPLPPPDSLEKIFPVQKPDWHSLSGSETELQVTWLGQSTLLVRMEGVTILTDPMLSPVASPVQFAGPRRYRPVPVSVDSLPPVEMVIISHDHYDHLDRSTVRALGNRVQWLVPLGLKHWFRNEGITNVQELDWWEEVQIGTWRLVCTPAQHFSGRTPWSRNRTLWCSWVILGAKVRFYYAGDTGYCPVFKELGDRFGPFDLAAIPIGAYAPRWFMSPMHVDPHQAVQVHLDLKSRHSVGIHWGTFVLSDEPAAEPGKLLKDAVSAGRLPAGAFRTLRHGETWRIHE